MDRSKKGPLEGVVKNIISDIKTKGLFTEEEIADLWQAVVGKRASRHARPASLKRSRLVVNVDGSSWLYELTLRKKEILKKLSGRLRGKNIKEIRFRIGEAK